MCNLGIQHSISIHVMKRWDVAEWAFKRFKKVLFSCWCVHLKDLRFPKRS